MAFDTIALTVRERTLDGQNPTYVQILVYPLADSDGTLLKEIKDTTGQTVMSGHANVKVTGADAAEVAVTLPDPRDDTLLPSGFGYQVKVTTNYFSCPPVTFGPDDITAHAVDGVLYLEDVTDVDTAGFTSATPFATTVDLDAEATAREDGDAATLAAAEAYTDGLTGPVDSDDITDATAVGKALLTAANQAAGRTAIGAGTSSFDGAYADLSGKPTLGTAAAAAAGDFDASGAAAAAQAAAIAASVPTGRTVNGHPLSGNVVVSASDLTTGTLPAAQLPAIAVVDYAGDSANQAAMLALTGQKGDWTVRTDLGTVFVIIGTDPTQLASWKQLSYPTAPVTSVASKTGAVSLVKGDVGLGSVDNVADASKPVSTAQAAADAAVQAFAIQRANHTGTESADVLTDGTTNKAFLATERTKLAGIATGATANSSDATLENRANHTGTQAESTVTNLVTDLAAKLTTTGAIRNIAADGATTGAADNATIIQAAIDAMATAGGGIVFVPKGTWTTSPLVMKDRVRIVGEGWGSVLKLKNGANDHFLTLEDDDTEQTAIVGLVLDGNKANQSAGNVVNYINTTYDAGQAAPSLGDPNHYMQRVLIRNAFANGLYVGTGGLGQNQFDAVVIYDSGAQNFYIESPDNHLVNCISGRAGLEGFYDASNSNRFLNCKSWGSGQVTAASGHGFRVQYVSRGDFSHCEAQDNKATGYYFNHTSASSLSNCKADRNGLGAAGAGGAGDGLWMFEVTDSLIDVTTGDRNSGGLKQRYGYNASTGNTGNIIRLAVGANATASGNGTFDATNDVVITDGTSVTRSNAVPFVTPSDHALIGWTYDPATGTTGLTHSTGKIYVSKIWVRSGATINTIQVYVTSAGATLANAGVALYDASGVLLSSQVNAGGATATAFQATGLKTITLSAGVAVTGPVYVGTWFTGTTMPSLLRLIGNQPDVSNLNLAAPNLRTASADSGLTTAAPSPLGTQTAINGIVWAAVA